MITDIQLQSFRSYTNESFELSPGVNIIVGPNASGKTNLLEAVLVVARGGSYRARDAELIKFGAPWARLTAHTNSNDTRVVLFEPQSARAVKSFKINNQPLRRLGLNKSLPVVVFEPNHLQILNGSPELRRQYIDDILEQTKLGYPTTLRQYKRALAQRNSLLKKGPALAAGQLFAWDVRLSELGEQIALARSELASNLATQINEIYNKLSDTHLLVEIKYQPTASVDGYATELLHKLENSNERDFARGFTSYGPHREDIGVFIGGHPIHETASRGENRTMLLVLKILEAEIIEKARGHKPILLLDDVFSELDGARRQALTKFLQPYQTFITTTDADVVLQHFTEMTNIIPLGAG